MFIIKFIRFLFGYVTFTAKGGFPERFVNLCTKNKIPLWNMRKEKDTVFADTTVKAYKSIRKCAKKSGVRVKLSKKHGLPFFIGANRTRVGLCIGFAVAVVTVSFLSTMVWNITVSGNKTLTDEQILEAFSHCGVKIGARASSISSQQAEYQAKKELPLIAWASVNVKGSSVEIVVSELTLAPEFPDTSSPCNIIADEDGTVISVETASGKEQVKSGDAVLKGDLLISGITENLDGTYNLKSARGKVFAKVKKELTACYENEKFLRQTDFSKRYILCVFSLEIPLGVPLKEDEVFTQESYLSNGKTTLPLGIITQRACSYGDAQELGQEYIKVFCAKKYAEKYREMYTGCEEIISQSFSSENTQYSQVFSGEYECKKEIGKTLEIFVEK